MVNGQVEALDLVFEALTHPIRREMIRVLATREVTVAQLASPFAISAPAVTKHLKILEKAGLLVRVKEGRVHRCRLDPAPLTRAKAWIDLYRDLWNDRLDALGVFLQTSTDLSTKEPQRDDPADEQP